MKYVGEGGQKNFGFSTRYFRHIFMDNERF